MLNLTLVNKKKRYFMAPDCSRFPFETCCFADLATLKCRIAQPGAIVIPIELCLLYNPAGSVQSAFSKARKISDKWWKGAIFTYFSCGNWERKLFVSLDLCTKVFGRCREFKIQPFGKKTRFEAFVFAEITLKYWTCRKTAFSTFFTKTYHLVKQGFLSQTRSK